MSLRPVAGARALAAFAGASVWVSLGTLAVTDGAPLARAAALPSWWVLFALASTGIVASRLARLSLGRSWPLALTSLLWLPYLPGAIPAAFLMWQGPLEGLVWIIVLVAMVAGASPSLPAAALRGVTNPSSAPWLAGALFGVVALAAFGSVRGVLPGGDEPHYLVITQSLMLDADLRIENNHARGDYLSYFSGRLRPDFMTRGADGQIYSIHSPGLSVIVMPAFAIAGYGGAVGTVVLLAVLASALTWWTAWLLSASVGGAWVGWAAVFLSTPFLFHAFTLYPDGPAALIIMAGIAQLVRMERGQALSRTACWLSGIALSALPWLHTRFALIAGAIGLCLVARVWPGRDRVAQITALMAVPMLAAVTWFGYFWMIWQTPNPSAPYGSDSGAALAYIGRGVTGLLFDQQFGLLVPAPIFVVALAGLVVLARSHLRLASEFTLIVVPYVVVSASYAMWWGGISAPARFLCALLPLAAIPIAYWWPRQSATGRVVTLLLLVASMLMVWPRAVVDGGRLLYSDRTGFDHALNWAAQSVDLPLALPSVHRDAARGALQDTVLWLGVMLVSRLVIHLVTRRARPGIGATWAIVAAVMAGGVMVSASVVWARHAGRVMTPSRSQIAALGAFRPQWHTTIAHLEPLATVNGGEFLRRLSFATTDRVPPRPGDPALLRATGVPAGDYELLLPPAAPAGQLTMVLGRNDPPVDQWTVGSSLEQFRLLLKLPVDVASLTIRGRAPGGLDGLHLRAIGLSPATNSDGRRALRAARYGATRVFAFDEQAYLEPTGFWTRAGGTATVVIDRDEANAAADLALLIRAGAVPTSVVLSVGEWSLPVTLAAGQSQTVRLPALGTSRAWAVTMRSGAGFRPSAIDPASDDVRQLAVWVEIP